jgi:hypothetical protein
VVSLQGKRTESRPTNTSITKRGQVAANQFRINFSRTVLLLASREAEQVKQEPSFVEEFSSKSGNSLQADSSFAAAREHFNHETT